MPATPPWRCPSCGSAQYAVVDPGVDRAACRCRDCATRFDATYT